MTSSSSPTLSTTLLIAALVDTQVLAEIERGNSVCCSFCHTNNPPPAPVCQDKHTLQWVASEGYPILRMLCGLCMRIRVGQGRWQCTHCEYEICPLCKPGDMPLIKQAPCPLEHCVLCSVNMSEERTTCAYCTRKSIVCAYVCPSCKKYFCARCVGICEGKAASVSHDYVSYIREFFSTAELFTSTKHTTAAQRISNSATAIENVTNAMIRLVEYSEREARSVIRSDKWLELREQANAAIKTLENSDIQTFAILFIQSVENILNDMLSKQRKAIAPVSNWDCIRNEHLIEKVMQFYSQGLLANFSYLADTLITCMTMESLQFRDAVAVDADECEVVSLIQNSGNQVKQLSTELQTYLLSEDSLNAYQSINNACRKVKGTPPVTKEEARIEMMNIINEVCEKRSIYIFNELRDNAYAITTFNKVILVNYSYFADVHSKLSADRETVLDIIQAHAIVTLAHEFAHFKIAQDRIPSPPALCPPLAQEPESGAYYETFIFAQASFVPTAEEAQLILNPHNWTQGLLKNCGKHGTNSATNRGGKKGECGWRRGYGGFIRACFANGLTWY